MKRIQGTILTALVLALLLSLPVYALAPGEPIDDWSAALSADASLSGTVFWTGKNYRTETVLTLTPGGETRAFAVSASPMSEQQEIGEAAAALEKEGLRVLGGTNGGFFTFATGIPVGLAVSGGVLLADDEGLNAVGFRADGSIVFGRPALSVALKTDAQSWPVRGWNRSAPGEWSIFTPECAETVPAREHSLCLLLRCDALPGLSGEAEAEIERVWESDGAGVEIPEGRLLALLPPADEDTAAQLPEAFAEGTHLTLEKRCAEGWEDVDSAVGILYPLLTDGEIAPELETAAAPRTAVGVREDGTLLLYTLDGRQSGYSVGGGLTLVAERLRELGCVTAGALDGGGSTLLTASLPGEEGLRIFNSPSEGKPRKVANYILLAVPAETDGGARQLSADPIHINAVAGAQLRLTVRAGDGSGLPAPLPEELEFTVSEGLGTVIDGVYHAAGSGSGEIRVSAPGLTDAVIPVRVTDSPEELLLYGERYGLKTESLTLWPGYEVDLTVRAYVNHLLLSGDDRCYVWSVEGAIGSVDETGHFIPGEISAEGTLRAAAGESSAEIPIRIWTGIPFADVPASHPLFDAVKYVYDNGIFKGTSDTAFEPETVMDRAMLVTVLWRLEGSPEPETAAVFEDVAPETWYGKAVAWAAQQGIVKGYSDTLFAPTDALTREQVFAILHRWAGLPEAEETADVPEDTDDWALASLQWAVGAGVFVWQEETPPAAREEMSRALVADALMRFQKVNQE